MRPSSELLFSIYFHLIGSTHSLVNLFKFYPTTTVGHSDVLPPGLLVLSRISGLPLGTKVWISAACLGCARMAWALVATVLLLPGCYQSTLLVVPLAVISPWSPAKLVHKLHDWKFDAVLKKSRVICVVWKTKANCLADVLSDVSRLFLSRNEELMTVLKSQSDC